ncbi:hypothetical protein JQ593_18020 [Bradyrhizobium viridifuturi]|uniref:hypothetical protein n=1 Tax=uncultured Bradyrhizobium sp. TaxID=199684 RepID=UPI001BAC88A5|nr:hypothetical protein [uncultured Bradyrhizobium sp.]MBR1040703.1 hypothetical protein [Bradyrhizobium viridifuturi]MBR1074991.1 hypothetical protein [Bradyrhizobium viridifuturi]
MMHTGLWLSCVGLAGLILVLPASAAEINFAYKTSYRNVTNDPDGVWAGKELAVGPKGTVTIHEYELRTPQGELLISQIWNEDCSSGACPTRLVQTRTDGRRIVLVNDMMHQIVPPDDPRFADLAANKTLSQFAQHPFALSDDGKTLVNGDYKFELSGAKQ